MRKAAKNFHTVHRSRIKFFLAFCGEAAARFNQITTSPLPHPSPKRGVVSSTRFSIFDFRFSLKKIFEEGGGVIWALKNSATRFFDHLFSLRDARVEVSIDSFRKLQRDNVTERSKVRRRDEKVRDNESCPLKKKRLAARMEEKEKSESCRRNYIFIMTDCQTDGTVEGY